MASQQGARKLVLIAKSSKEQVGYEKASDTAGARLCRAQRAPGPLVAALINYQNVIRFQETR